jgi:hypothetical protein
MWPGQNVIIHNVPKPNIFLNCITNITCSNCIMFTGIYILIQCSCMRNRNSTYFWRVYTRHQEKVNSIWIAPNLYSMNIHSPLIYLRHSCHSVSDTGISSVYWDERDSSSQVCESDWLAPPLGHNQSRTTQGITALLYMCWLILHKINSNKFLLSIMKFSGTLASQQECPTSNVYWYLVCHSFLME